MGEDPNAARAFAELGTALREATKQLHTLDIEPSERLRLTRRLLAITNVGKADLTVAAERLRRLLDEIEEVRIRSTSNESSRHKDETDHSG